MRIIAAAILLSAGSLSAQVVPPDTLLPDSTYLHLTMDLPILATLTYETSTPVRSAARRVQFSHVLNRVDVIRCDLMLVRTTQRLAERSQNFQSVVVTMPLKALDFERVRVHAETPRDGGNVQPQPWVVAGYIQKSLDARIVTVDRTNNHKTRTTNWSILVRDQDAARQLAGWLKDAAARCDSWRTAPIKPIR